MIDLSDCIFGTKVRINKPMKYGDSAYHINQGDKGIVERAVEGRYRDTVIVKFSRVVMHIDPDDLDLIEE
jgi:hypothetical protein